MHRILFLLWTLPCLAQSLESRLIENLQSSEPAVRQAAVETLAETPLRGAFEALLAACDDPCPRVRCAVAVALGVWPDEPVRVGRALGKMLDDADARVLRSVCWQLRLLPEAGALVSTRVRSLLGQPGMFAAAAPLVPSDELSAELLRVLAALSGNASERAAAARCLARLEAGSVPAEQLLSLLADRVGEVREAAWQAVRALRVRPSLEVVLRGLADVHAGARFEALRSLRPCDGRQPLLRAAVEALLGDRLCAPLARRWLKQRPVWGIVWRGTLR